MTDKIPVPTGAALTALDPTFRENPHEYLDYLRLTEPVHQDQEFDRAMRKRRLPFLIFTRFPKLRLMADFAPFRKTSPSFNGLESLWVEAS